MARPWKRPFYEELIQNPKEGQEWLAEYDSNCRLVMEYLMQNKVGTTLYDCSLRCLEGLRAFLLVHGYCYSKEISDRWFKTIEAPDKGTLTTLRRLEDMYTFGSVQPLNAYPLAYNYGELLNDEWKAVLEDFLQETYPLRKSCVAIRNQVSRFLCWMQGKSNYPEQMTYADLEEYLANDIHRTTTAAARYKYSITDILLYLAARGRCSAGICWFPYYWVRDKVLRMETFPTGQVDKIESLREESQHFPTTEYASLIPGFLERFDSAGYSKAPRSAARYTLHNLLLFLDMHSLGYHPGIAQVWLLQQKEEHAGSWKQYRRILNLFELFVQEGDVLPQVIFHDTSPGVDVLPDWCRTQLTDFLALKEKEGWEASTLCMYRSAGTRFCRFLFEQGLTSFEEITPQLIKDFNLADIHMTAEGKNAYNVRVRKFMQFMERRQMIPNGISQALSATAAKRERIVVCLTDEEKSEIAAKHKNATTAMELRDRAMLLLGMKMGIRGCDIVSLRLSDINWNQSAIRLMQKKTRHEIILPMPVEVGNAIYLYLKKGRPKVDSPYVFLKNRTPYNAVCVASCRRALERTLPDRKRTGSGFHVTRKTFATDQLCNNVKSQTISDLLGHKDSEQVFKYLNLDSDRMLLCPLSLAETNLLMEAKRYD